MDHQRQARTALLAGCALLLAACAPMHKQLTPEAKARIRDVHVQVVVPQEGFTFSAASPNVSAALGGGLIGAIIDASVQKSRQENMRASIEPVLDELLDIDFRAEARNELQQAAAGFPLPIGRAEVVAIAPTTKEQAALLAGKQPNQAYLRVLMQYRIDLPSRVLTTRSSMMLWQPGSDQPAFTGGATFVGTPDSGADRVAAVREQMRQAVRHTMRMAALSIDPPTVPPSQAKLKMPLRTAAGVAIPVEGDVVAEEPRRAFFRTANGALFSIERPGSAQ